MKYTNRSIALAATTLLTACTTNPPLLFADTTSFGLHLGTETASVGGSVVVGYQARSLAVVPTSALTNAGQAGLLRGRDHSGNDALSVFAVFEAGAEKGQTTTAVGQLFATGIAAQALTRGYECKLSGDKACDKIKTPDAEKAAAASAERAADSAERAASSASLAKASADAAAASVAQGRTGSPPNAAAPVPTSAAATDEPYQKPLVYARTDRIGIGIGGTLAEQGLAFTLGYSSRNLALIPVVAVGSGRQVEGAEATESNLGAKDAFSVLGQFNANSETKGLGFEIDRYFATGVAARNLARGIGKATAAKAEDQKAGDKKADAKK